jgi:hypothetical protein
MLMRGLEHKNFYVPTIPYWWHLIASTLPGKAHAVGSQIWFCYRVSGGKFPVKLSRQYFSLLKFSRHTVRRALFDLERAGLIAVQRSKGRSPRITITLDAKTVPVLHKKWLEREYH